MTRRQLARFIFSELQNEQKPENPLYKTGKNDYAKEETDYFLTGEHNNPMKGKVEFNSCFYTEPEVTIPAERFVFYG